MSDPETQSQAETQGERQAEHTSNFCLATGQSHYNMEQTYIQHFNTVGPLGMQYLQEHANDPVIYPGS